MHTITIVQAQAMATNLSKSMGATLTTRTIIKTRVNDLLVKNKVAPFQCYVAVYLDSEEKLIDYTTTQQNNLLQKCDFDVKLIPVTLGHLHKLMDQFRRKIQTPITRQEVEPTDVATGRVELLERNKEEIDRLKRQVERDILQYKCRSICKALTRAMTLNWVSGGMLQQYMVQTKDTDDQLLANRLAPYLPRPQSLPAPKTPQNKTPKTPYTPRGGRSFPQRGGKKPRGGRTQAPSGRYNNNTNVAPKGGGRQFRKLHTRPQSARPVGHEKDADLGRAIQFTKLKYVPGSCNNFQIWNECAVRKKDPNSCTFKHSCSLCYSPLHGRRTCHRLAAPEDPTK